MTVFGIVLAVLGIVMYAAGLIIRAVAHNRYGLGIPTSATAVHAGAQLRQSGPAVAVIGVILAALATTR